MYKEKILGTILDQKNPTVGVGEEDIAETEAAQGVRLPLAYRQFLRECGRSAGLLFYDIHAFFPYIRCLKANLAEMVEEERLTFELPANAFVSAEYLGDQYHYFLCDGNDDPPVFHLSSDGTVIQLSSSFSEFIFSCIEEDKQVFLSSVGQSVLTNW